mmetsp:Transcript_30942/g.49720  ORF Transcript_30942/g.49720 Transcript_30942/m.49720 type:complete len:200 (-) Transcript_30942:296-895(-)
MAARRMPCRSGTAAAKNRASGMLLKRGQVSMKNGPQETCMSFRLSLGSIRFLLPNTENSFTHRYAPIPAAAAAPMSLNTPSPNISVSASTTAASPPAAQGTTVAPREWERGVARRKNPPGDHAEDDAAAAAADDADAGAPQQDLFRHGLQPPPTPPSPPPTLFSSPPPLPLAARPPLQAAALSPLSVAIVTLSPTHTPT